jgi:hypothetical protein
MKLPDSEKDFLNNHSSLYKINFTNSSSVFLLFHPDTESSKIISNLLQSNINKNMDIKLEDENKFLINQFKSNFFYFIFFSC